MKWKLFYALFLFIFSSNSVFAFEFAKAKATIKVVDENGLAVSNARIMGGFFNVKVASGGVNFKGVTDTNGECSVTGQTHGEFSYGIEKEGYYSSEGRYREWMARRGKIEWGKWQPWNPVVTQMIRKIINPIPMYARMIEMKIPEENVNVGFDLLTGDWISPYGSGQRGDLFFKLSRRITTKDDYEGVLELTFTNLYDGIVANDINFMQSSFRLPRYALESGYQNKWSYMQAKNPQRGYYGATGLGEDKSYFFRVRSTLDDKGQLKESLYGKINGEIRIQGITRSDGVKVIFKYYLNPTPNDRNMEFDPKQNLFKNLKSTEEINVP